MRFPILIFIFITFFLNACNTVEDSMPISNTPEVPEEVTFEEGLFVINEGNFDWGHGTLSFKKYESDSVYEEIYKQRNEFEIGNVAQSMTIIGEKGYLCVNNSERIDIIETKTAKWIGRIEIPRSSPRYLLPIDDHKAYITELYADRFYVLNLDSNTIQKEVRTTGWTEKMCKVGDFVYMTQTRTVYDSRKGGQFLLKINAQTDVIVDSLALPYGPIDLQVDKNEKIWVLCNGGLVQLKPAIAQVDPITFNILKTFDLSANDYLSMPSRLRINKEKDILYYIQKDIFSLPIDASQPTSIIPKEKRLFYGLGVSPHNNDIYVADAIDYVQKGWIFKYNQEGVKLDSFKVGVIPNEIVFQ
ncbi:DUF5074 domain-containing protein [Flammeovirga sp. OC4]|uniref:DUF5074 domain-containing protein n=1 Tax=Flammeovirga sp. OC4 TaxID=1382345 RepID=UPI00155D9B1B|nr:DUF5074 domain-containing protein [Flammeovirga sp. OC4]